MRIRPEQLLLYAVTDRTWTDREPFIMQIKKAISGGITILQLREKDILEDELYDEAVTVKELCDEANIPFIVNDNWEIALRCGASGVHVGIEDAPVAQIREKAKAAGRPDFIIGATAKTIEQAKLAEAAGADYLGVGAVFPSTTKANAIRITREQLQDITSAVSIPCVAIGGLTFDNIDEIFGSGVKGAAVVSAIFGAEGIVDATAKLKEKIENGLY